MVVGDIERMLEQQIRFNSVGFAHLVGLKLHGRERRGPGRLLKGVLSAESSRSVRGRGRVSVASLTLAYCSMVRI